MARETSLVLPRLCTGAASTSSRRSSHAAPDLAGEVLDMAERRVASLHLGFDLLDAVKGGRVVPPAEDLADLHERQARAFPHEIHRDVTSLSERPRAGLRKQIADRKREILRGFLEDELGWDLGLGLRHESLEGALGEAEVDRLAGDAGERDHADQSPLELTNGLIELRGDELDDVVRNTGVFALGFELKDRDTGLEIGRLHVDAQAPPEPADKAFLQARQLVRRPVGGNHDLPGRPVQVIERMEELGLGLLAFCQELDVVHEEHIDLAVASAKRISALPLSDGLDELRHELLSRDIFHAG